MTAAKRAASRPGLPLRGPTSPIRGAVPDAMLITAAGNGDLYAWETLVRQNQGLVFRCAYLLTRDAAMAEEITATAFIRAYRGVGERDPNAPVRPWLMRIATSSSRARSRELAQQRDAKVVEREMAPRLPADPLGPRVHAVPPAPVEHEALTGAFDRLGDEDRVVVASRYCLLLPRGEMAVYLGIAEDQVDGRLREATSRLRSYLAGVPAATDRDTAPGHDHYRVTDLRPQHFAALDDDHLATLAAQATLAEVPWKPDVTRSVTERLARDAAAYPERFAIPRSGRAMPPAQPIDAAAAATVAPTKRAGGMAAIAGVALVAAISVVGFASIGGGIGSGGGLWAVPGSDPAPVSVEAAPPAPSVPTTTEATVMAIGDAVSVADPASDGPVLSIVGARPVRDGRLGARVQVAWTPLDVEDVERTELQRKTQGGGWRPLATAAPGEPVEMTLTPGRRYNLRVRALDDAGEVLSSERLRVVLAVRDWDSEHIARTPGDWTTTMGSASQGGALASKTADAGISTTFKGASLALVSPVGPWGGAMRIRVDGGDWLRGDLRESVSADRQVVFSHHLGHGEHLLDISVDEGVIALDSMMFVRTPEAWSRRS